MVIYNSIPRTIKYINNNVIEFFLIIILISVCLAKKFAKANHPTIIAPLSIQMIKNLYKKYMFFQSINSFTRKLLAISVIIKDNKLNKYQSRRYLLSKINFLKIFKYLQSILILSQFEFSYIMVIIKWKLPLFLQNFSNLSSLRKHLVKVLLDQYTL